jgi:hypothetical protein
MDEKINLSSEIIQVTQMLFIPIYFNSASKLKILVFFSSELYMNNRLFQRKCSIKFIGKVRNQKSNIQLITRRTVCWYHYVGLNNTISLLIDILGKPSSKPGLNR